MKAKLLKIFSDKIVQGASIFFIGNMAVNLGAFVYHLIAARLLGPVEYGIFGSLLGLVYLLTIPISGLDLLVTKMVSDFPTKLRLSASREAIRYFSRLIWIITGVSGIVFLLFWRIVGDFLHLMEFNSLLFVFIIFILTIWTYLLSATLKGFLKFQSVVVNQVLTIVSRIIFLLLLIKSSFSGHIGSVLAYLGSYIAGLLLYFHQLSDVFKVKSIDIPHFHQIDLKKLGLSSFIFSAAFAAMYSLDVVMSRHYLSGHEAGIYSSLSTAGKIMFFATSPLGVVALPIISRKSKEPHTARKDLLMMLGLIVIVGLGALSVFSFFPKILVNVLFSAKFSETAQYLPLFGLAMLFYALNSILGNFLLALNFVKVAWFAGLTVILELVALVLFHNSISQIVWSLVIIYGIFSLVSVYSSLYATRKV